MVSSDSVVPVRTRCPLLLQFGLQIVQLGDLEFGSVAVLCPFGPEAMQRGGVVPGTDLKLEPVHFFLLLGNSREWVMGVQREDEKDGRGEAWSFGAAKRKMRHFCKSTGTLDVAVLLRSFWFFSSSRGVIMTMRRLRYRLPSQFLLGDQDDASK